MSENTDVRMRGSATVEITDHDESVHPFLGDKKQALGFSHALASIARNPQGKKIIGLAVLNVLWTVMLFVWCTTTNSMALTAYAYLTIFDLLCLFTCLVSIWVQHQKPTPIFSFGFERFEVLAVFATTVLAQFGSLFVMKESIERMLVQPDIHTGRLLIATSIAFSFHLLVTYTMDNRALNHVIVASSSSWLQEHVSDISESICNVVPGLSKLLLPRINPFALVAFAGAMALVFVYLLIDIRTFYPADTWAAMWIAMMTFGTMTPMSMYSGKILLQTTPSHIIGQLDKAIREASTLDGVLEFRNEHFWNLTFGTMAGSFHVRVRRDADEQLVLAHVYSRLSNLVSVLTVQIFKDDWSRPSSLHVLDNLSGTFSMSSPTNAPARMSNPSDLYNSSAANSNSYNSSNPKGASPYSGLSPGVIPSRTDPGVAGNLGGPVSGNIPALRLAANATGNSNSQQQSTANVVNLSDLENSFLGGGVMAPSGMANNHHDMQYSQKSVGRRT